ncbi:MAG: hypothetical protein C0468_06835 [Planctomyces sp.]|nr:hypothetical protein [Planctomyces sp.]
MRIKRPGVIWAALTGELWRLLLISTSVLMVVLAFAVAIKPLADGKLGLLDSLLFMVLALVPMLQYALPFSACFAATLAHHRMAQDNELVACYAGGVSHRALLAPAALSGLALAAAVGLISDQAIPRLLRRMSELVSDELPRLVASSIERGQALTLPSSDDNPRGRLLYAESMIPRPIDPAHGAFQHFALSNVLAVDRDPQGKTVREMAARFAFVWVSRDSDPELGPGVRLRVQLQDMVGGERDGVRTASDLSEFEYRIPSAFTDDPKYLSLAQMLATYRRPERLNTVDNHRRQLALALAEHRVLDSLRRSVLRDGSLSFRDSIGRSLTLRAAAIAPTRTGEGFEVLPPQPRPSEPAPQLEITLSQDGGRQRRSVAARGWLSTQRTIDGRAVTLTLTLADVAVLGAAATARSPEQTIPGLIVPDDPLPQLLTLNNDQLAALADATATPRAADASLRLAQTIDDARREILSKAHERAAVSLACFLMVLLGAIMGMRLRDALPLTVYLWAFFPALGSVLAISSGQRFTHGNGAVGLPALYGGVLALGALVWHQYARLARH